MLTPVHLAYSRTSDAKCEIGSCDGCGAYDVVCFVVDTSGGEYGAVSYCIKCINDAASQVAADDEKC